MLYIKRVAKHGKTKRPIVKWYVCQDGKILLECKTKRDAYDMAGIA
jgi:hypothetical protein